MRVGPLVIAVALALVAGFVALKWLGGSEPVEQPVVAQVANAPTETSNVYIAAQFIPIGTVISQEMITTQPWPSNLVSEAFVTDGQPADTLVGKIARSSFQHGEPISLTKLAGTDQGSFLAGSLPKGMRAVTINTDETLGVAGFVFPGDRVDVLITHQVPKWDRLTNASSSEQITETLLANVPVLAVDQIASAQEIQANNEGGQQSTIHVARTITMMVNLIDGEKLRLGEKVGQLSLALRSIEDRDTVDMAALLRYPNITQYPIDAITNPNSTGAESGIRVIRGVQAASIAPIAGTTPAGPIIPGIPNPLLQPAVTAAQPATSSAVNPGGPSVATPAPEAAPAAVPVPVAAPHIEAPVALPAPPSPTPAPVAIQ